MHVGGARGTSGLRVVVELTMPREAVACALEDRGGLGGRARGGSVVGLWRIREG